MVSTRFLLGAATTVACALVTTPPAFAANGVFGGSTADGQPIVLRTDKKAKRLKSLVVAWVAACDSGQSMPMSIELDRGQAPARLRPRCRRPRRLPQREGPLRR